MTVARDGLELVAAPVAVASRPAWLPARERESDECDGRNEILVEMSLGSWISSEYDDSVISNYSVDCSSSTTALIEWGHPASHYRGQRAGLGSGNKF